MGMKQKQEGVTIAGARHFDSGMVQIINKLGMDLGSWEKGFIDQFNKFITREEAWKIADANGQIRRPTGFEPNHLTNPRPANVGDAGLLFSENLY